MPKALVPLAEGCEELEAVTIIDLLRRAKVEVVVAGLKPGTVRASRGTVILPDTTLEDALHASYNLVALPGGLPGADHLADDARIIGLLKNMAAAEKLMGAVCAAPKVLAKAGVLDGRRMTCYPGAVDLGAYPKLQHTGAAVERDGNVITSRGPGTAMDFALALIEALCGADTRASVETGLVRG